MTPIYSNRLVSYADFINNTQQVVLEAGNDSVAVITDNKPLFYLLTPGAFEALINQKSLPLTDSIRHFSPQIDHVHIDQTIISQSPAFEQYVEKFLASEALRVKRNELTQKSYQITLYRLQKYISPDFGKLPINHIHMTHLEAFVEKLSLNGVGGTTIAQYLAIVRKILKIALLKDELKALPHFPVVLRKRNSRGGFTIQEYLTLQQVSWRMRGAVFHHQNQLHLNAMGLDKRYMVMTEELHYLIGFMANSFVRPSDIKLMQHKHIQVIDSGHKYLRLTLPETKKHRKPIVTMRRAVSIYQKLLVDSREKGWAKPDDYVFLPAVRNRAYAMRILGFLFNWLLFETNLKMGPHHVGRTLYSLRHTSITFRLLYGQGIDMLTLARNARTSVNMIEKHYASTLSGEMNIDLLQSKRKLKKPH